MKTKDSTISNANVYQLDGKVPIKTAVPFGLQHILAMFVANISPILIVTAIGFSLLSVGASSFGGGTGFTQVPEIFAIFPQIVENVFAENCVAVVFLVSIILNLVLPKNMEAAGNELEEFSNGQKA